MTLTSSVVQCGVNSVQRNGKPSSGISQLGKVIRSPVLPLDAQGFMEMESIVITSEETVLHSASNSHMISAMTTDRQRPSATVVKTKRRSRMGTFQSFGVYVMGIF